jgi:iron complex outermembrane receptor protein
MTVGAGAAGRAPATILSLLLPLNAVLLILVTSDVDAVAQTQLPEIVVTSPSPIVRPAPSPRRPKPVTGAQQTPAPPQAPTPAPEVPLLGTLPVVTDQFATVTVVPEAEVLRTPGAQLGDVLFDKPGVTGSTFAPGASRPIVRGLDNYRVRIQENGIGANAVSDLSEDHAVPIDPLAAKQVEVVRGPATLRWGSQAIGGVVNVTNDRIPDAIPARGYSVETKGAFTSGDNGIEGGVLLDAGQGNFAFHADAFGRSASDYRIPSYPYLFPPSPPPTVGGKQPNSALRTDSQSIGGSYIFDGGFAGIALSRFASLYRIPGIEATDSNTRIDLDQIKVTSKGEYRAPSDAVDTIRYWVGATDYKHNELGIGGDGTDGVRQTFTNKEQEGRLEVQLTPFDLRLASLTSAFGIQAGHQQLTAPGDNGGLFDPNETTNAAAFLFNEFKFSNTLRMQLAGRVEQVKVTGSSPIFPADFLPDGSTLVSSAHDRNFTPVSGSFGLLKDLPWGLVASLTAQYVERAPRAPELFSRGAHDATATFEIGNPNLAIETGKTVEVGLRRAADPLRFEATAYYTQYNGFIFKRLTGIKCGDDFASCGVEDELNQIVYSQRDATFRGAELQAQWDVLPVSSGLFGVEGRYDVVRATFTDGTNVPRIPPQRIGGGIYWRDPNWLLRLGLLHAFAQDNVAAIETPTPGYNLLRAELSCSRKLKPSDLGPRDISVGVVGDNLLNDDVRNSASFKKDEVLLPGRTVRLFANLRF